MCHLYPWLSAINCLVNTIMWNIKYILYSKMLQYCNTLQFTWQKEDQTIAIPHVTHLWVPILSTQEPNCYQPFYMHATSINYAPHIVGILRTVPNTRSVLIIILPIMLSLHINLVHVVKLHSTCYNKMFLTDRRLAD